MMVRRFLQICHIGWAVLIAFPAMAQEHGSVHGAIDQFMADYTHQLAKRLGEGSRIDYNIPDLDSRSNLQPCATPLAVTAKDQIQPLSRVNLQVSCASSWSIYVPIDLDVYRLVVVAVKPLAPGAVITAVDVELTSIDISQLIGSYITALDEVIGMGVKRPISQGRPVIAQQLEAPLLIRRGEAVVISAEGSALAVKMPGTALTDGHRGEQIRIKNQTSSRVVDARVIAPGQVAVSM
ncbi:MAG TPA: flagellar basal body P-ring formation chaperone FlgA [Spongiibacteraceae bacterium]|jgi:flagella basal body P-ring formation protein FlgA